jgi:DNA polymerase-3 subunit epsilon
MKTVAVIDFKTTGSSPDKGDRPIEVAVVVLKQGQVMDRYHSLMNAEVPIPEAIQSITGITEALVREAPSAKQVMKAVAKLIDPLPLGAHNASFDCRFLDAEWHRIRHVRQHACACSMLLSRRLYPDAPDHKLGTLGKYLGLPIPTGHQTALTDAEMTAQLFTRIAADLKRDYRLRRVPHALLCRVQTASKAQFAEAVMLAKQELGL